MKSVLFLSFCLSLLCTSDLQAAAKLGEITKRCETTNRATEYHDIVAHVNNLRKDPKKFAVWYKNTYERAFGTPGKQGLNTLRDLGTYDPDPAKNKQKAITTAADARKKGTPLQKLEATATPEQFAEQLSIVHPSNNRVFTAVMECVHTARNAKEDIVETVSTTMPESHVFTQTDLDSALSNIEVPSETLDDSDIDLDENLTINPDASPVPVY